MARNLSRMEPQANDERRMANGVARPREDMYLIKYHAPQRPLFGDIDILGLHGTEMHRDYVFLCYPAADFVCKFLCTDHEVDVHQRMPGKRRRLDTAFQMAAGPKEQHAFAHALMDKMRKTPAPLSHLVVQQLQEDQQRLRENAEAWELVAAAQAEERLARLREEACRRQAAEMAEAAAEAARQKLARKVEWWRQNELRLQTELEVAAVAEAARQKEARKAEWWRQNGHKLQAELEAAACASAATDTSANSTSGSSRSSIVGDGSAAADLYVPAAVLLEVSQVQVQEVAEVEVEVEAAVAQQPKRNRSNRRRGGKKVQERRARSQQKQLLQQQEQQRARRQ
ncbi:hypothetical protein CHLRE_07g338100v5 [Chlamydomonas reinhardtii]|uniref:Uncharacterized protein n=1 Tax=Chlamydomonas reinhardtii TaxID=3055 RepID=A0A2K3DKD2_CHLRE|nr:uncharacterized protein CHLRE_07g338100v5 [Chlamydomonas reinhardtii]PNW80983.1 hypothetical protein CHLRE_07g338100v5 [Chlamydomonas reinhardtii]